MSGYPNLEHHVDTESNGATVGWQWNIDAEHSLWCGEISRACFEEADQETQETMVDDYGWFLVLYAPRQKIILGKLPNEYLGRDVAHALALGLKDNPKMITTLLQDAT